jgi:adenylate cyclase
MAGQRGSFKRHWPRVMLSLATVLALLGHSAGLWPLAPLNQLDRQIHDARLQSVVADAPHADVVIVDIDERSLAEVGRWPWSRDQVARLVHSLFEHYQVRTVSFDMVFAEADSTSPSQALREMANRLSGSDDVMARQLQLWASETDRDQKLVDAVKDRPVVLGYYFTSDRQGQRHGQLPAPVLTLADPTQRIRSTRWDGYGANMPSLVQAAPRGGFFNAITDEDGIVRSLPLLAEHEGKYYESLALATYRAAKQVPLVVPRWSSEANEQGVRTLGALALPLPDAAPAVIGVDGRAAAWVPFRGPGGIKGGSFRYLSAAQVLDQSHPVDALRDKIVLVGTTAPGLLDLRNTPVGQAYPGVEVHANLIAGMIDGRWLQRPDYAEGLELTQLVVVGVALAVVLPLISATAALLVALGVAGLSTSVNIWFFQAHGLVLPLASTLVLVSMLLLLNMSYGYLSESRSRRRLATLFGHYVPRELVREMYRDPEHYSMQAQSRELTVMFCDMRGFTSLSESLQPAALQHLLNKVFSRLTQRIQNQRGTIDKYMGDCVMAFWGAPIPSTAHATQAVQAAIDMSAEVIGINRDQLSQGLPTIGVGIGLSTGDMMVGDMGSDIRRSYTVIGDAVNLGSRLEGLSRVYGVDIIASHATRLAAPEFLWLELDRVRVKGREQPETIYTPLCSVTQATPAQQKQVQQWQEFLILWRARQWDAAETVIEQLLQKNAKNALYLLYTQRLTSMRYKEVPADWDGVTDFETK